MRKFLLNIEDLTSKLLLNSVNSIIYYVVKIENTYSSMS
jgi:hypothetical protein